MDIGGQQGDKITYTVAAEAGGNVYDVYVVDSFVIKDNYVFQITFNAIMIEMTDEDKDIYDEVLNSFQFQ